MAQLTTSKLIAAIRSNAFFWLVVALLVGEALWIALSARYPMPFDEDFHLGVIRLYAHHLSPFWSAQPAGADQYGAIARDPSYLYHWLMSFPYRLVSWLTSNESAQVLALRLINIVLFASGLALWRRLLLKSGASRALVHTVLLVFILIPVVPQLAAQINYDNLLFPAVSLVLLLTARLGRELKLHHQVPLDWLAAWLIACMLTSLVKYAFLPIFVGVSAFVILIAVRSGMRPRQLPVQAWRSAQALGKWRSTVWLLALLVATLLFCQRYGVNVVKYHTPIPDCGQVLTRQHCSAYGPWIRDYNFAVTKPVSHHSPVKYVHEWLYGMWLRLFFALDGPRSQYQTRGPLLVPAIVAIVFSGSGIIALVVRRRQVMDRYHWSLLLLLGIVVVSYVVVLYLDEYRAYARTDQPVAINGRYLIPVLLPALLLAALAFERLLRRPHLKVAAAAVSIVGLAWGGGALTYILRSNESWYWSNPAVAHANRAVQRVAGPITPGYHNPILFLR